MALFWKQLWALLQKEKILAIRYIRRTIFNIVLPMIFIAILGIISSTSTVIHYGQLYYETSEGLAFSLTHSDQIMGFNNTFYANITEMTQRNEYIGIIKGGVVSQKFQDLLDKYDVKYLKFNTLEDLKSYSAIPDKFLNEKPILISKGVVFTKEGENNEYAYNILVNLNTIHVNPEYISRIQTTQNEEAYHSLQSSGVVWLESFVGNCLLQHVSGDEDAMIDYGVVPMKSNPYNHNDFLTNYVPLMLPVFLVVASFLTIHGAISRVMTEKLALIRESMKIMGLTDLTYFLSLFLFFLFLAFIQSFGIAGLLNGLIFPKSNYFVLYLVIFFFLISLFPYALVISAISSERRVGILLGALVFFGPFIISTSFVNNDTASFATKAPISLLSTTGLQFVLIAIASVEAQQDGIHFYNFNDYFYNYSVGTFLYMCVASFFAFLILALYLDNVIPSGGGVSKGPFYFLQPSYWRGGLATPPISKYQPVENSENFEEVPEELKSQFAKKQTLTARNLKKVYPDGKLAVENISFELYSGQIFALLGHNGAGKTSTISMLTGFSECTGGEVLFEGYNIFANMGKLRRSLGYCPQHDILYPDLTVFEQMQIMGACRGVPSAQLENEIANLLDDLHLANQRNVLTKNLSGGQKRKLSTAIAFLGGNRLIFLDEPSSGLDTQARHEMWDMLKEYKKDKIIVLTTHYMDEADFLGDRIGIMSMGKIKCLGSPLFLKNRFGIGYNLTLVKKDGEGLEINETIREFVASRLQQAELTGIAGNEIAFKLPFTCSKYFTHFFEELDHSLEKLNILTYGISITTLEDVFLRVGHDGALNEQEKEEQMQAKSIQLSIAEEPEKDHTYTISEESDDSIFPQLTGLFVIKFHSMMRNPQNLIFKLVMPMALFFGAFALLKTATIEVTHNYTLADFPLPQTVYYNTKPAVVDSNFNIELLMESLRPKSELTVFPYDVGNLNDVNNNSTELVKKLDTLIFTKSLSLPSNTPYQYGSYFIYNMKDSSNHYEFTTLFNMTCPCSLIPFTNILTEKILQLSSNNTNTKLSISLEQINAFDPYASIFNSVGACITFISLITLSFSLIPGNLASIKAFESFFGLKHQILLSGLSLSAYWIINFAFEIVILYIPFAFIAILYPFFTAGVPYGWVLFLLFPVPLIAYSFAFVLIFKDPMLANMIVTIVSSFLTIVGALLVFILKAFPGSHYVALVFNYLFMMIPTFTLVNGFVDILFRDEYHALAGGSTGNEPGGLGWSAGGKNVCFLIIDAAFYLVLIYIGEMWGNSISRAGIGRVLPPSLFDGKRDEDVIGEEQRVEETDVRMSAVHTSHIFKAYNKQHLAVNDVSFGVAFGEVFALLGVNGAGKTSTFKMFISQIFPNKGKIFINGLDISGSEFSKARKIIGYCPQFDVIYPNITVEEHLEFYSKIKGIISSKRNILIQQAILELGLSKFKNVRGGKLSGGNKRKLCVAIAIIGNPALILLDEPSTGMDPKARRFMWSVISNISTLRKKCAVIITTHSMEEAEALCTKLGIMVNGSFRCYGSTQHIKNKFGQGFEIELKIKLPTEEEIREKINEYHFAEGTSFSMPKLREFLTDTLKQPHLVDEVSELGHAVALYEQFLRGEYVTIEQVLRFVLLEERTEGLWKAINQTFKKVKIVEHYNNYYKLNIDRGEISIGNLFGIIENMISKFYISEYSVGQTSLEQIFNTFAKQGELEISGLNRTPSILRKSKDNTNLKMERFEIENPN